MIKATFGTGSSVMMNIGEKPIFSDAGIVTSLAWSMGGKVNYVLEGNINYTGSVIKWLVDDVKLLGASRESGKFAAKANPEDTTYLVPAFSGLGAPYWDSEAKAAIVGMTRSTGKAEIVKAAEECIAYQITDLVLLMQQESGLPITEIRVDGGPTKDKYLMQFQSDMLSIPVAVPKNEELSGIGAAYAAGFALGLWDQSVYEKEERTRPNDRSVIIMKFFIGTANIEEIRKANDMGVIAGVTTNPSLIAKEGRDYATVLKEIAQIVDGPISGEVKATTEDAEGMIEEGRAIYALDPKHMVVKIR